MTRETQAITWPEYVEFGVPDPVKNFPTTTVSVSNVLEDNEILVKLVYVSVDPYMRGRMRNVPGYFLPPFQINQPLNGYGLGQVVESKATTLPVGTYVAGSLVKWQALQVMSAKAVRKVDEAFCRDLGVPLSINLGVLGMPGMAAWASLERIGKPKTGETVFVSASAGAVGLVVGQLCKHVYGCSRVIGCAGSDEKISILAQYGYDAAFNYKKEKAADALARLAPHGIDLYYDNVGGETLDAALGVCNRFARVVCCGSISGYNTPASEMYGVKNLFTVVTKELLMQGFITATFMDMWGDFEKNMKEYVRAGKVKHVEHVFTGGLCKAGQAFVDMMAGANIGKSVVACDEDPYRIANTRYQ